MKTQSINGVELAFPESWEDVSFRQYITYLRGIKPYGYTPSRPKFMDAVFGDWSEDLLNAVQYLEFEFQFIYDGPPMFGLPTKLTLGASTLKTNLPIEFRSGQQVDDLNRFAVDLFTMDNFQRIEQAPIFCALYCQPLIHAEYSKTESFKLIESINSAPVGEVINLYTWIMLELIKINSKTIERTKIINHFKTRLN